MCTFPTAPPTLSFFWPWQAPGGWLLFVVVSAVLLAPLVRAYAKLPRTVRGRQRELVLGFACAGCTLTLASVTLLCSVTFPSSDALLAWDKTQERWAITHQCSDEILATVHLLSSSYNSLDSIALVGWVTGPLIGAAAFAVPSIQQKLAWLRRWQEARSVPR